jgi:hypothetical protein
VGFGAAKVSVNGSDGTAFVVYGPSSGNICTEV